MKNIFSIFMAAMLVLLVGCDTKASIASRNLSRAADMFELERRIVFYDAIQGVYLLSIEGRCSLTQRTNSLDVTCRTANSEYKKHKLGLSDNVTYFSEQLDASKVNVYNYRVTLMPQSLVPDIEISTSLSDNP